MKEQHAIYLHFNITQIIRKQLPDSLTRIHKAITGRKDTKKGRGLKARPCHHKKKIQQRFAYIMQKKYLFTALSLGANHMTAEPLSTCLSIRTSCRDSWL